MFSKNYFFALTITILTYSLTFSQWGDQINPTSHGLNSVSAVSINCCWIAGDIGTILYTSNSGNSWLLRRGGIDSSGNAGPILGLDTLVAMCVVNYTSSSKIYFTTNKGISWTAVYSQSSGFINDLKKFSSRIYAYGNPIGNLWQIYLTTNFGLNWSTSNSFNAPAGIKGHLNGLFVNHPVTEDLLWFGTDSSIIYKSTNFGVSWSSSLVSASSSNTFSVNFALYPFGLCGGDSSLYKSSDGGSSWSFSQNINGGGQIRAIEYNSGIYWCAKNDTIYFSTDFGITFNFQYTSLSEENVYNDISFTTSGSDAMTTLSGWAVANIRGADAETPGIISHFPVIFGIHKISNGIPSRYYLAQNFPNPFNPVTKIQFEIPRHELVSIKIYNILGKEISTIVNKEINAGVYEVSWDGSNFPSGIYFYKLITKEFVESKKMIIVK